VNKVKKRCLVLLIICLLMILGFIWFLIKWEDNGRDWAAFPNNQHAYDEGVLVSGEVRDRNGITLMYSDSSGKRHYHEDSTIRRSTLHAVGDPYGNIGGSATDIFAPELMGYSMINGTYSYSGKGHGVELSIDAALNETAYNALAGREGCVAVMDHKTGQIICMVSTYAYDPASPPASPDHLNKFLSGVFTPGSIYKLVTCWAAIENMDTESFSYNCTGSAVYGEGSITCGSAHGQQDIYAALSNSCNCAFAHIAQSLGGQLLAEYMDKAGLTQSHQVEGMYTAAGSFDPGEDGSWQLGWAACGQYNDTVNPYAMLRFVSAIANGGKAAEGELLYRRTTLSGLPYRFDTSTDHTRIMSRSSALELKNMMINNVRTNYGVDNFPNLPMCAKSGTAEAGGTPHAWFTGFLNSEEYPYSFIVLVEHGGSGAAAAGPIAKEVLTHACFGDEE